MSSVPIDMSGFRFKKTKPRTTSSSSDSEKSPQSKPKHVKLSKKHLKQFKNYVHFLCEECDFKTQYGDDFKKHLEAHNSTPELDVVKSEAFQKAKSYEEYSILAQRIENRRNFAKKPKDEEDVESSIEESQLLC